MLYHNTFVESGFKVNPTAGGKNRIGAAGNSRNRRAPARQW
jgi:hypothetical protein